MHAFLGQGFSQASASTSQLLNSESIDSLGGALEATFADDTFDTATAVVAFATESGVQHFSRMYDEGQLESLAVHVGVDENVTSQDALESLLESDIDGYVYHGKSTFHPKLFYFEGPNRIRAFVGSGNLTNDGLYSNYEAALVVEVMKDDLDGTATIDDLQAYLSQVRTHGTPLSESLIAELHDDGKITTEQAQRRQRAEQSSTSADPDDTPSYQADVPRQSPPSRSLSNTSSVDSDGEEYPISLTDFDEGLLVCDEMPDIPKVTRFKNDTDRVYYRQLISENDNQVNLMRRIIRDAGQLTKGELKQRLREERDVTISGSFDADLRVLWRSTDEVAREGRGDDQLLIWTGK